MNIYTSLNQMIDYIEAHLTEKIDYHVLAKFLGVNVYTMERFFSLLVNVTITEYIRNRRLSMAFYDLYYAQEKIIDVAMKYGYENPTSFSRAFQKFHGVKPSEVKKGTSQFHNYPKFHFNEEVKTGKNLQYRICLMKELVLYGKGKKCTEKTIGKIAPEFYEEMYQKYHLWEYGMVYYEDRFHSENLEYWVLNETYEEGLDTFSLPASKWLVFKIDSKKAKDIQELSRQFYDYFLPSCKFNLRSIPELERYYEHYMELWVPIED